MTSYYQLISDIDDVSGYLQSDVLSELTYPKIFRECPEQVFPAILRVTDETGDTKDVWILNQPDSDPFAKKMSLSENTAYGRYFEWNATGGPGGSFEGAVRAHAGDAPISVGGDLAYARWIALKAGGPVMVAASASDGSYHVYHKATTDLVGFWEASRAADTDLAQSFIASLPHGAELKDFINDHHTGFDALDAALAAADIHTCLITSAHNLELFTGLSSDMIRANGVMAIYRRGASDVVVLAKMPLTRGDFIPFVEGQGLLAQLPTTAIGIEEQSLPVAIALLLQNAGHVLQPALPSLRKWQEANAAADLVYYIVAGNAVLAGFAHAKDWFDRARNDSYIPQERDLDAVFQQGVADFAASYGFAGRVSPYFSIIHSGARTLLPATAGDYPARFDDLTIKFDMGVLVKDSAGVVRGCSDIARTICATPALQSAHDALRAALIDSLIPAMKEGMTAAEVHAAGVTALRGCEDVLRAADLMPEGVTFEGYTRDCGHILHRTTTATIFFLPGMTGVLRAGMIGCVEFVWPVGNLVLAVEDGYIVTASGAVPFTHS